MSLLRQGRRLAVDSAAAWRGLVALKERLSIGRPPPVRRVGRFEIAQLVGCGGFGRVYRAKDPHLGRDVAVKTIRLRGEEVHHQQRQVRAEARALAQLNHPNVVSVYDVGCEPAGSLFTDAVEDEDGDGGEHVYIVMEHVRGQTLAEWAAGATRSADEILDVYAAAGRGLEAAHVAGVLHRDFKPANAMLAEDGRVVVLDFGLATLWRCGDADTSPEVVGDVTRCSLATAGRGGTPRYMAPEQQAGGVLTPACDVYALAASLYEALFGQPAFSGFTMTQLWKAKQSGMPRPPRRHDLDPRVVAVLARGLAAAPSLRWPSVDAFLTALRRARRPRLARVSRALLAGLALLVVVAAPVLGPVDGAVGSAAVPSTTIAAGAGTPDPDRAQLRLRTRLAVWATEHGDREADLRDAVANIEAARSLGEDSVLALIQQEAGHIAFALGRDDEAAGYYAESFYTALAAGEDGRAMGAAASAAATLVPSRQIESTRRWVGTALAMADRGGSTRNRVVAIVGLGQALLRRGDFDEAVAAMEETRDFARRAEPDDQLALQAEFNLGVALLFADREGEAIGVLEHALVRAQRAAPALESTRELAYTLGAAHRSAGSQQRAEELFRATLANPEASEDLRRRACLALALLLTESGQRHRQALALLDEVAATLGVDEHTARGDLLATRGKVLLVVGRTDASEDAYRRARGRYARVDHVDAARLLNVERGLDAIEHQRNEDSHAQQTSRRRTTPGGVAAG